ncbi:MAG TPA: adenylate/guanylate cyclase domain-containing protein [Candidatus Limnocylindrales bacterium]|nr:adenylate/guanylate cyclase domain-containing protein [Candidatus Limnocylindrales bacterium]
MTRGPLPSGTVTFLFTDVEGSTRLVADIGDDAYRELLDTTRQLIAGPVTAEGGVVFGAEGDAQFAAFGSAVDGIRAAAAAQRAIAGYPWPGTQLRVRMGVHTGAAQVVGDDYVGLEVHRAARVAAAAHGGQVLVSGSSRALASEAALDGLGFRDLGDHRLKDLAVPERLFQLTGDDLEPTFPPPRTLDASPNNLPPQLTPFVGRAEVDTIGRVIDEARLVTLTGPGGTGKTRLSLELAGARLGRYTGGVWFVPLASIRDPELVASAIATAVGLVAPGRPPLERLIEHFRDRDALVVLDNFEQVVDAAPTVSALLAGVPGLRVVVTSRGPLRIAGERELPVPPLAVPAVSELDPDALVQVESVRLFVERAMAVRPDFVLTPDNAAAITEIVHRLDGLPLAIELAAARVRLLPPVALAQRLGSRLDLLVGGDRDRSDRQRTLRGAIEWSHDLLDAPARLAFARLGVIRGSAPLDVAVELAGPADELGADPLATLEALLDQSLVRALPGESGESRISMLETIREYALERLTELGETERLRDRHAAIYERLAAELSRSLYGRNRRQVLDRYELEHDDLRAALEWRIAQDDCERAAALLVSTWRFWQARGHIEEGRQRADEVLEIVGWPTTPPGARIQALEAAGGLAYWAGDLPLAHRRYAEQLEIARRIDEPALIANALLNLAASPTDDRDQTAWMASVASSLTMAEEALARFRALGDEDGEARAFWQVGESRFYRGEIDAAEEAQTAALGIFERRGEEFWSAWARFTRGLSRWTRGDVAGLLTDARAALERFERAGDLSGLALLGILLAAVLHDRGLQREAQRLAGAVQGVIERSGAGLGLLVPGGADRPLLDARADPALRAEWEAGFGLGRDEAFALALAATEPDGLGPGVDRSRTPG